MLTALFIAVLAQPAATDNIPIETATASQEKSVVLIDKKGDDIGFIDKYHPFSVPDNLDPVVEENMTMSWILMVVTGCIFGPIWIPIVMFDGNPGDYLVDIIISTLIQFGITVVTSFFVVGMCYGVASWLYFLPVAAISAYDRNLKMERGGSGKRGPKKNTQGKDEQLWYPAAVPVANSMAY